MCLPSGLHSITSDEPFHSNRRTASDCCGSHQRDTAVGNRGKLPFMRFPLNIRNRALMVGIFANKIAVSVPGVSTYDQRQRRVSVFRRYSKQRAQPMLLPRQANGSLRHLSYPTTESSHPVLRLQVPCCPDAMRLTLCRIHALQSHE